jgi:hypothetical protein
MSDLYVRHVRSIEDETDILKKILNLQTEIRAKRENERVRKNEQSHALSSIFDPVTTEMRSIKNALDISSSSSSNSSRRRKKIAQQHEENMTKLEGDINRHNPDNDNDTDDDNENSTDDNDHDNDTEPDLPTIEHPKPLSVVSNYGRQLEHFTNASENKTLYDKTLKNIRAYLYAYDDKFGLDVNNRTISGYSYTIDGNRLKVDIGPSRKRKKSFVIKDPDVWKWLIIRNPESVGLNPYKDGEPTPAFREYVRIAKELKFVERAQQTAVANGKTVSKRIRKYKLILNSNFDHKGRGFLFTTRAPLHVRKKTLLSGKKRKKSINDAGGQGLEDVLAKHRCSPNIVVMPTDNRSLLEKLTRCMGEIDAGNQSLVNIAVPLKEEAVRRGLISANNPVFKNLNWVLA